MSRRKFMMSNKRRQELKEHENRKKAEALEAHAKALNIALGGKRRKFVSRKIEKGDYNPPQRTGRAAERINIPSLETTECLTAKVEQPKYTGDKLIGIALMHKSNYVPVFTTEEAVNITKMRRG